MDYKIVHSKAATTTVEKHNENQIKITRYYKNGKVKTEGVYNYMVDLGIGTLDLNKFDTKPDTKVGTHTWYHKNGRVFKSLNYTDGKEDYPNVKIYHSNGKVMEEGAIKMGHRVGPWKFYTKRGKLEKTEEF